MNENIFYYYFEHWGMRMGGCEHAALDDAAHSFRFGKMPSIGLVFCCGAPWAWFFTVEILYLDSYIVFMHNTLDFMCLGDWEWMDGERCCWMTSSQLGRYSQTRLRFLLGSLGSLFHKRKRCIIAYIMYIHVI